MGMEIKLRPSRLADMAGISPSYASEIINGRRAPSRSLAIHIFRRTGWKHPVIEALSPREIKLFERVEPYKGEAVA